MTTVLAVDLAAKHSAACVMTDDYNVLTQFDSFAITEDEFIDTLVSALFYDFDDGAADVMVIEDLPHGLNYSTITKAVCRLQGRIVQAAYHREGTSDDILFLAPATWRAHYPQATRGTGPKIVVPIAAGFGYTPPDITARAKGKGGPTRARKVETDYCSAYLIARWAIDTYEEHHTFDVPGTSRYDTQQIRK